MLLIYFWGWAPHCWTHWGRLCANTKRAMLQVSQIHVLVSMWKYPIESFVRLLVFKGCALWHGTFVSNKEDEHARVKNRMSMQMIRVNQKEGRPGSDREKWLRHDLGDSIGLETLGIYPYQPPKEGKWLFPFSWLSFLQEFFIWLILYSAVGDSDSKVNLCTHFSTR